MAEDPRVALDKLIKALEDHYAAATTSQDPDAEDVIETENKLQEEFFNYDNVLFSAVGVELPFDIVDEEDEDDDDLNDDDDDVFDDDEYDFGVDEDEDEY